MINWRTIGFGVGFGLLDSITLPIVKAVSQGSLGFPWMAVSSLLYASSPFIFLKALETESLTVMNLIWDLSSDLIVTFVGLFIFKESLPPLKILGVLLSFVSIFLMTYDGDGWNAYLSQKFTDLRRTLSL
jgi:multidrug transporter EmrE-like cation transporter